MKTTFTDLTIEDLLPHRGNMLLVKEVLAVDDKQASALFAVDKSWPMADKDGVHPLILIELAAQTAGICNGWDRIRKKGRDSNQTGWLVGIKKAEFSIPVLPFGAIVTASSENTYSFENLREVSCELSLGNQIIGRATLQLFQVTP
jgi:predicted hotdog family 3-hydroxylacyl-ACP dehydratase